MSRTAWRPTARGELEPRQALVFSTLLCAAGSDLRVVEELAQLAIYLGGIPMVTPPYVSEVTDDQIVAFFRSVCRVANTYEDTAALPCPGPAACSAP